jgi:mono/diheme cytochrome c family protein
MTESIPLRFHHLPHTTLTIALLILASCRQDMHDQPKERTFRGTSFFADHRSARPQVPGTVARGELDLDDHFYRGKIDGKPAEKFPMQVTASVIDRGQERYGIYCAPCHGVLGDGDGIVVSRGMRRPPSFHIERLQHAPAGYFFDVITNGFGAMFDYSDRVKPADRWAITAYIRVLQQSQNSKIEDVPDSERERLVKSQ